MGGPFVGSEALAAGTYSRYELARRFVALYPDIYVPKGSQLSAVTRAEAAWLWTHRRGTIAGFSASALHGSKWISPDRGAEVIHENRRPPKGILVWTDAIESDEIQCADGRRLTTPARTGLDLACRYPPAISIAALDALCRASELKPSEILRLLERYTGRRGIRRARSVLELVDAGAQSPKETWLRLVLIRAGLPRPQTQIMVHNGDFVALAYIDMGWEEVMVGVEYDGDQHRTDRRQYVKDIKRMEMLERLGWQIIRVVAEDHPDDIIRRVREALARRR
ncbi:DUF559 domain-containing protein [Mycobacterium sp. CBMA271]|uniref:DUF559 domain-containing protein n=1 Tax=unclassified Mycobacteroides TaxID=2618759 RepID=UPI0012DF12F8|nr:MULTISPECIES: DUF559 domain-containing protein [unclassified Mycobacteroides]MUM16970.1 hypothetical protein [Mycobacteroides sp. CBMA 326]MUM24042.1 DUF559 domain-containing protein [Mycobacteroides sp. CBMA 271]